MSVEQAVRDVTVEESRGSLALWFGVLGSPLAWGGHLAFGYALEEWFACSPSATDRGELLGLSVDQASVGFNTLMVAVAAAAGLTALACWRRLRDGAGEVTTASPGAPATPATPGAPATTAAGDTHDRSQWMAFAGVVEGAIFVPFILLGYLPPLVLGTCVTSA